MFILSFVRFLCGYVVFEVQGGFLERFLNLCAKEDITLWDVMAQHTTLRCKTTIQSYKRIRRAARASGVKVHITQKKGLPFFLKQNQKRVGLLIGIGVFFLLMSFLSTMVWSVRVVGNETIEAEKILESAESLGIYAGARKSKLEPSALSEELLQVFPELSWAAINIDFSTVQIEVREAEPKPLIADTKTPSNIIASEDGILTRLDVYSGTPSMIEGSAVRKGDLLISGVMRNQDGTERLKGASGHAFAKIERPFTFTTQNQKAHFCQQEQKRYILYFFSLKIPIGFPIAEAPYQITHAIEHKKTVLPLGVIEEHQRHMQKEEHEIPVETAKELMWMRFFQYQKAMLQEGKVLEEEFYLEENQKIHGKFILEKDIGKKQQIFVEKISD